MKSKHRVIRNICTVPYRTVPCRTVPYRAVPYRAVPYHTVPCRTVPCSTVPLTGLCRIILYFHGKILYVNYILQIWFIWPTLSMLKSNYLYHENFHIVFWFLKTDQLLILEPGNNHCVPSEKISRKICFLVFFA